MEVITASSRYFPARQAIEDEMRQIEQELGEGRNCEGQLRVLRESLNLHTPISILPIDVLIEVFILCVALFREKDNQKRHGFFQNTVPITQICRFWRSAAHESPELWSYIVIRRSESEERIRAMLSLSKERPLEVKVNLLSMTSPDTHIPLLKEIITSGRVIHSISFLCINPSSFSSIFRERASLSSLRSFSIVQYRPENFRLSGLSDPILPVNNPSVEHIELEGMRVSSCKVFTSPALRHLVLKGSSTLVANSHIHDYPWMIVPSIADFLTSLRAMPQLEEIFLHCIFPQPDTRHMNDRVSLPHLRHIDIEDDRDNVVNVVQNILLTSPLSSIRMHCFSLWWINAHHWSTISDFSQSVAMMFTSAGFTVRTLLLLESPNPAIQGLETAEDITFGEPSFGRWKNTPKVIDLLLTPPTDAFITVLDNFPVLPDVEAMYVQAKSLSAGFWEKASAKLPNLHTLRVKGLPAASIPLVYSRSPDQTARSIFPRMSTVMLDNVHFVGDSEGPKWRPPEILNRLRVCLEARNNHKSGEVASVRRLIIQDCKGFDDGSASVLRSVVEDVSWSDWGLQ